jgi:chromosome segregation ATPase
MIFVTKRHLWRLLSDFGGLWEERWKEMSKTMADLKSAQAAQHQELELIKGAVTEIAARIAPLNASLASLQQNVTDLNTALASQQNSSEVLEVTQAIQADTAEAGTILDQLNALLPAAQGTPPGA